MDARCCYLEPLFDDPGRMDEYFAGHGFDDIVQIVVYTNHAFVFLPSYERCCRFVDAFDEGVVNGKRVRTYVVRASDVGDYKKEPGAREKRLVSKTVVVRNYPAEYLSDRNLWNDFRECGFVRDVEARPPLGYIRFDTQDDAIRAVKEMDGAVLSRSKISVEMIPDREVGLPNMTAKLYIDGEDRK